MRLVKGTCVINSVYLDDVICLRKEIIFASNKAKLDISIPVTKSIPIQHQHLKLSS